LKIVLAILVGILFTACEKERPASTQPMQQQPAKPIQKPKKERIVLQDGNKTVTFTLDEKSVDVESDKEVVLLLFFTSWCPACKAEMEEFEKLHERYGDKIDIVALQLDDHPVKAPFFVSHDTKANQKIAKKVYSMLHIYGKMPVPVSLLLKKNRYVIHYVGAVPIEMVETDIKNTLGE